jgi:D-arabinose 1-dehydrogenase-like Zn-dependent alcohol dehydrogenase
MKGLTTAGYFAEYATVDAAGAVAINLNSISSQDPSDSYAKIAPLFCAGATAWDALERAKLCPGENVAVVGAGGLGQITALYAASFGARVMALDVRDEQLAACKLLNSAIETINTAKIQGPELLKRVKSLTNSRGFDGIIVTSGALAAFTTSLPLLAPLARLVIVGLPQEPIPIPCAAVSGPCARYVLWISMNLDRDLRSAASIWI